jgi:hypothetical protein
LLEIASHTATPKVAPAAKPPPIMSQSCLIRDSKGAIRDAVPPTASSLAAGAASWLSVVATTAAATAACAVAGGDSAGFGRGERLAGTTGIEIDDCEALKLSTGAATTGAAGAPLAAACGAGGCATEGDRFQPTGGTTCTMLPHLGHARIWPMTDSSLTFRRTRQVVH